MLNNQRLRYQRELTFSVELSHIAFNQIFMQYFHPQYNILFGDLIHMSAPCTNASTISIILRYVLLLYVTGFAKRDLIAHFEKIELLLP